MKLRALFFFLITTAFCFSQNETIDSLLAVIKTSSDDTNKVHAYISLINSYRNDQPEKAMKTCTELLELSKKINHPKSVGKAYLQLAIQLRREANYEEAIKNYLSALKIFENINDKKNVGKVYGSLGITYWQQGNFPVALDYYQKSMIISKEIHDTATYYSNLNNIGGIYWMQKKLDSALYCFDQVLARAKFQRDTSGMAEVCGNIGDVFMAKEKYSEALSRYLQSLHFSKQSGNRYTLLTSYSNIGIVYFHLKDFDKALEYQKKSMEIGIELNARHNLKEVYKGIADIYSEKNEFQKAYDFHKKYSDLKDSLLNEESSKQIAEMQAKYDTEKKEQQITLLNKDKELQDAQLNRQKIIIWSVAGGLLVVLILSIFIFRERRKSEKLLLNILPAETAKELKRNGKATARYYESVTVMFTDFKGFTSIAEKLSAEELVSELDFIFKKFDEIISKYNIEKIKTIGDAYMCASGLPTPATNHAENIVKAGLEIQQWMINQNGKWQLRIGIHTGPVTAGVVGDKKFAYDIWGDAVNTASRMESSGEAGKINISGSTYEILKSSFLAKGDTGGCQFLHRGKIPAKNKGEIDMYFVEKT